VRTDRRGGSLPRGAAPADGGRGAGSGSPASARLRGGFALDRGGRRRTAYHSATRALRVAVVARLGTAAFVWSDELAAYRFGEDHPLNPRRLQLTVELLHHYGVLGDANGAVVAPRVAEEHEIAAVHDVAYIEAVRAASSD